MKGFRLSFLNKNYLRGFNKRIYNAPKRWYTDVSRNDMSLKDLKDQKKHNPKDP